MLAFTFTIHPWIVQGIIAFVVGILLFLAIRPLVIRRTKSLNRVTHEKKLEQDRKSVQERARLEKAFPQPWLGLWDDCKMLGGHKPRAIRLENWLELEQKPALLPVLSMEATKELATLVAQSSTDSDFVAALKALSPYSTEQRESQRKQQEILRKKLPAKWYELYTELKNYPEARSLFLQKIDSSLGGKHPCREILLSTEQATLLADALGKNEAERGHYAHDLTQFIALESEKRVLNESDAAKFRKFVNPDSLLTLGNYLLAGKIKAESTPEIEAESTPAKWKHHHSPKCPVCQADMKIFTSRQRPDDGEKFLECSSHRKCLGIREYKEWERRCKEWDREVIEDAETIQSVQSSSARWECRQCGGIRYGDTTNYICMQCGKGELVSTKKETTCREKSWLEHSGVTPTQNGWKRLWLEKVDGGKVYAFRWVRNIGDKWVCRQCDQEANWLKHQLCMRCLRNNESDDTLPVTRNGESA